MNELTLVNNSGDVRVSHRVLAEYMGLRQDAVRKLVEDNIAVFEQISQCPFEMEYVPNGFGERETKVYYLDSDQTNLLIGLTRNTDLTIELKANVVKAFRSAKQAVSQKLTPEESARVAYRFRVDNACAIADLLGYSAGHKRKEALEIGVKIEQNTGIPVIPSFLLNDPQAINPDTTLSPFHGTHAALVAMGTTGSTVSTIAKLYDHISPTDINKILCAGGYQTRVKACQYTPTEQGKLLCNQRTLASGRDSGKVIITNWLYNDNKALRDFVIDGVQKLKQSRIKKVI